MLMIKESRAVRAPDGGTSGAAGQPGAAGAGAGALGTGAAPGAAGSPAAAAAAPASGDWTTSLAPDHRTLVQTKGWKSPAEALASYANLEKSVGYDKVALPPKGANGERDWSAWDGWNQLGRPETPDKYDLTKFKPPEGVTLDDTRMKGFLGHAHKLGLTQAQTLGVIEFYGQDTAALLNGAQQGRLQSIEKLNADMAGKWGAAKDQKIDLARKAAKALGFDDAQLDKLEATVGSFAMLDRFATIGEQYFNNAGAPVTGSNAGGAAALNTPAGAKAEIDRIMGEAAGNAKHAYWDKKHPEHTAVHDRLLSLHAVIAQVAADKQGQAS